MDWIKCSDKLPDNKQWCLVCIPLRNDYNIAYYNHERSIWDWGNGMLSDVEYWMTIPDIPELKKGGMCEP